MHKNFKHTSSMGTERQCSGEHSAEIINGFDWGSQMNLINLPIIQPMAQSVERTTQ